MWVLVLDVHDDAPGVGANDVSLQRAIEDLALGNNFVIAPLLRDRSLAVARQVEHLGQLVVALLNVLEELLGQFAKSTTL